MLLGIVGLAVFAIGLVGVALATRGGGGANHSPEHPDAAITTAPDDHPVAATGGGADLHFSTTSIDLGLVPLGKEVGYTFSFANVGPKPLRIGDINVRAVKGC
jgi:hypothetical protein